MEGFAIRKITSKVAGLEEKLLFSCNASLLRWKEGLF